MAVPRDSGRQCCDGVSVFDRRAGLHQKKLADGFADVQLGSRYQIGTSELFEFKGSSSGQQFVGAGNTEAEVVFAATDPKAALPAIYFLLGREAIKSMR